MSKKLLLKGFTLYLEDGSVYANIRGWRPKSGRRADDYKNSGYNILYASGEVDGRYTFFRDAVKAARQSYAESK